MAKEGKPRVRAAQRGTARRMVVLDGGRLEEGVAGRAGGKEGGWWGIGGVAERAV